MICVGLLVAYCFTATPGPIDSFCLVYQPVVLAKGDGAIVGTAAAKRRILANEIFYRQWCKEARK